jgi:prevent-host-death family protein
MSEDDLAGGVTGIPLREAKACFSELVARADLLGEVTVLTKHGRPAAAIAPAYAADTEAIIAELWRLLDRICPPGTDTTVDDARARLRRRLSRSARSTRGPRR